MIVVPTTPTSGDPVNDVTVIHADCLDALAQMPDGSEVKA